MRPDRLLATAAVLCAAAVAGCGLGEGEKTGTADLTVTRDYGAEKLRGEQAELTESDSVLSVLDSSADVETRYGGGFVQSIDGISGEVDDGRRSDWFFYVNGIESNIGAAEYDAADGERIWWDYRDWSSAMRVPAVVGSWPEPFLHGYEGERWPTGVFCGGAEGACAEVSKRLSEAGADTAPPPDGPDGEPADREEIRVLVGPWDAIRSDPVARLLSGGPERSGVFATISGVSPSIGITLLDERGRVADTLAADSGLVAALRPDEGPPTWVVTGTDNSGVAAAVELIGEPLTDRYAVATISNGGSVGVPVR